ncbi:MAG: transporter permease, partial [Rhodoferax sp.]|nr:transporter permease [Rhodoferax sp.]
MNPVTLHPTGALPESLSDAALARESETAQAAIRRRRSLIIGLRLLVLVVGLGGWELAARTKLIDPFFYSMPSMIWAQIVEWSTEGTSQGPLWQQVLVTLEETVMGFLIGSIAGVICGILL